MVRESRLAQFVSAKLVLYWTTKLLLNMPSRFSSGKPANNCKASVGATITVSNALELVTLPAEWTAASGPGMLRRRRTVACANSVLGRHPRWNGIAEGKVKGYARLMGTVVCVVKASEVMHAFRTFLGANAVMIYPG